LFHAIHRRDRVPISKQNIKEQAVVLWKGGVAMSTTQEQVISRVINMSDMDAKFILEIIERLIPKEEAMVNSAVSNKMRAFERLEKLRGGFPVDFEPDKELAKAREEKYGSVD